MKKAIVIFCEGPHDVAFVHTVLKLKFEIKEQKVKISEFPHPFGDFFSTCLNNHVKDDLTLDMVHKFFLPDYTYLKDEIFILVFNTGGEDNISDIKYLIANIESQKKQAPKFYPDAITDISYIFTYDSDFKNPSEKMNDCKGKIDKVIKSDLKKTDFAGSQEVLWQCPDVEKFNERSFAFIGEKVGFYIWSKEESPGTLEDIYYPIIQTSNSDLLEKSESFVNAAFEQNFKIEGGEPLKEISSKKSKNKKAVFTCMGQGKRPGGSLASMHKVQDLIDNNVFCDDENVKIFTAFLRNFI